MDTGLKGGALVLRLKLYGDTHESRNMINGHFHAKEFADSGSLSAVETVVSARLLLVMRTMYIVLENRSEVSRAAKSEYNSGCPVRSS